MNEEQVITDNETYSLFTITWDDLQNCTDTINVGNLIIKPITQDSVQFLQNEYSDVVQAECTQIILPENKVCSNNNNNHGISKPTSATPISSTASIDLPPCDSAEPLPQRSGRKPSKRKTKPESPVNCPLCNKVFNRITQYRQHMREHRNMKKFKCEHCSESYNIEQNFKVHMAMHSRGDPRCPICDRKFQRLASLKSHLVLHQVEETYMCSECLAEFDKEEDLNTHLESYRKEEREKTTSEMLPLVCTYCSYLFENADDYKTHVSLHIKAKRTVSSNRKFKRRNINTNRDFPHKCKHCSKSFAKLCLLERHTRIHTGERPFVCKVCYQGFSQKGTLQIHMNKHTGKKPFECVFCGSKFTQKGNLRVHLEKTHTAGAPGEKVYKCIHCTCIFKKVASLNGHITKVHLNSSKSDNVGIDALITQLKALDKESSKGAVKPKPVEPEVKEPMKDKKTCDTFVKLADSSVDGLVRRYIIKQRRYGESRWYICSYCSKEFKKPSDLIRHIRIHTREKPFKCKECGQTFALKSTLRNHLNTHARESCECVICLKKFSSIRTLNVHLRKHDKSAVAHKTKCYKCSVCDKMFVSLESANEHMAVHDVPDTIVLHKESPKIDVNIVMKQPMIETENGLFSVAAPRPRFPYASMEQYKNRPFKCHICNAAFLKTVHLKRHMLTHTGVKDFECEYCSKSFITKYALKEHMNYHTKTKNHECKQCKKKFYSSTILRRHSLMHTTQKPYLCPYCKKRFKLAHFCRKHIRKTHKRDLNESIIAMSETGELNIETAKIMDLTDMLDDTAFPSIEDGTGGMTPIETYNNISTLDNKMGAKRKTVLQENTEVTAPVIENVHKKVVDTTLKPEAKRDYNSIDMSEVNIDNLQDNSINYPIYITTEDLQLLSNSNVVNSLLPQLKLQNTDPLLLSSINELQDSNIMYPLDPSITQDESEYQGEVQPYDSYNPNMIFNPNISDIHLTIATDKDSELKKSNELTSEQIDLELNRIASQKVDSVLHENLIIFNGDVQKNVDMSYFNINFNQSDYIDINTLNLPANTSIGKVLQPVTLNNEQNVTCSDCKVTFKSFEEIDKHLCEKMVENEGEKDSGGDVANGIDEEVVEMEKDETPKVSDPEKIESFTCQHCGKSFRLKVALMRHISVKHKETVDNSCTYCIKSFKKRSDLVRHLRTHTGEKPFACNKCDKSFSLKSTLNSHYRTHNPLGTKEFKCHVCDTFVSCKSSLKKHMVIHTDSKLYSCSVCPLKFRTNQHRKSHMLTHDSNCQKNDAAKITKVLESMLLQTNVEIQNLKNDDNELPSDHFQESSQNLITTELPIVENLVLSNVHLDPILLQLPTNNYPLGLQLEIDGQLINMKQALGEPVENYAHEEIINIVQYKESEKETDKKVQCDLCLKWYASKSVLLKHKRLLHGKFKCDKCNKAFDSAELLQKHARLHFGYRPYSCSLCANSFGEEASLKIHLRRIHNIVDNVSTIVGV